MSKKIFFGHDYKVWHELGNGNPPDYYENKDRYVDGHPPHAWENIRHDVHLYYQNHSNRVDGKYEIVDHNYNFLVDNDIPFMYPMGTSINPAYWLGLEQKKYVLGHDENNRPVYDEDPIKCKPLFSYIPEKIKNHMREGKVLITIDMSFEGFPINQYHKNYGGYMNVCEEIHKAAERFKFPPKNIALTSENPYNERAYSVWCTEHKPTEKMNVITTGHMSSYVNAYIKAEDAFGDNFEEAFNYKRDNLEKMKKYMNFTRRDRPQRIFLSLASCYHGILDDGFNSMCVSRGIIPTSEDYKKNSDSDTQLISDTIPGKCRRFAKYETTSKYFSKSNLKEFVNRLPMIVDEPDVAAKNLSLGPWDLSPYHNSFFALVSDTMWDESMTVFLSEKSYRPFACFLPVIYLATPFHFKRAKELGYKSFSPFIDESYDVELNHPIRANLISLEMKKICDKSVNELLDWYGNQADILIHNNRTLRKDLSYVNGIERVLKLYERMVEESK